MTSAGSSLVPRQRRSPGRSAARPTPMITMPAPAINTPTEIEPCPPRSPRRRSPASRRGSRWWRGGGQDEEHVGDRVHEPHPRGGGRRGGGRGTRCRPRTGSARPRRPRRRGPKEGGLEAAAAGHGALGPGHEPGDHRQQRADPHDVTRAGVRTRTEPPVRRRAATASTVLHLAPRARPPTPPRGRPRRCEVPARRRGRPSENRSSGRGPRRRGA